MVRVVASLLLVAAAAAAIFIYVISHPPEPPWQAEQHLPGAGPEAVGAERWVVDGAVKRPGPVAAGVVVKVTDVWVGIVELDMSARRAVSEDKALVVELVVENTDTRRGFDYSPWSGRWIWHGTAKLEDDLGNRYADVYFGNFAIAKGAQVGTATVQPLKSVKDVIVFETPDDKARTLFLTLPGENVGVKGDLRFQATRPVRAAPGRAGAGNP